MGYEIAGGLGVKLAHPGHEVFVMVGDGGYLMMNSELQTSVMLGHKLIVTVLDNGGYGCIDRLQRACGGASFNNLLADGSGVDFAAHAISLGARAERVAGVSEPSGGAAARPGQQPDLCRRHRDRSGRHHPGRRRLVGRRCAGGVGANSGAGGARQLCRGAPGAGRRRMTVRLGANPIAWSNDDLPELGGDTARNLPRRGARGWVHRHRTGPQVPV